MDTKAAAKRIHDESLKKMQTLTDVLERIDILKEKELKRYIIVVPREEVDAKYIELRKEFIQLYVEHAKENAPLFIFHSREQVIQAWMAANKEVDTHECEEARCILSDMIDDQYSPYLLEFN